MKKLYDKSEMTLTLVLIAIYAFGQSIAAQYKISGVEYASNVIFLAALTVVLAVFVVKNGLKSKYGLCKASVPAAKFLWYIPLVIIVSRNLWLGAVENLVSWDLVCYLGTMMLVGFVEEILFRGMLFRALEKDNHTTAVIISSVTFGLGHILNMFNGVHSDWVTGISQIIGAIAIGFLFVILFERSGSLWPCIIAHSAIDMVSAFANDAAFQAQPQLRLILLVSLIVIIVAYVVYIIRSVPKRDGEAA